MSRTHLTLSQIRLAGPGYRDAIDAMINKLADHDDALDALEGDEGGGGGIATGVESAATEDGGGNILITAHGDGNGSNGDITVQTGTDDFAGYLNLYANADITIASGYPTSGSGGGSVVIGSNGGGILIGGTGATTITAGSYLSLASGVGADVAITSDNEVTIITPSATDGGPEAVNLRTAVVKLGQPSGAPLGVTLTDTTFAGTFNVVGNDALNLTAAVTGVKVADTGEKLGFYGTAPIAKQTGVAVSAAGIHAALVALGLISA